MPECPRQFATGVSLTPVPVAAKINEWYLSLNGSSIYILKLLIKLTIAARILSFEGTICTSLNTFYEKYIPENLNIIKIKMKW